MYRSSGRDNDRRALAGAGVGTAVHYPLALTQQPAYEQLFPSACPEAERWAAECVSLPCFPEMTESEIERVESALSALPAYDDAATPIGR